MKAQYRLRASLLIALLPAGLLSACSGKVSSGGGGTATTGGTATNPGNGNTGTPGAGNGNTTGATNSGGTGTTTPGGTTANTGTGTAPAGGGTVQIDPNKLDPESAGQLVIQRLGLAEYDNMLADLLGDTTAPAEDTAHPWGNDSPTVSGFRSATEIPDQFVRNFNTAIDTVVETALTAGKLNIPCTNPAAAAEAACVTTFVNTFGLKAFRRPLDATEQADAMTLFTTVRGLGLSFTESVAAIAKGMLQSASFLYHFEIGPTKPVAGADGLIPLTPWQVSARLASNLWDGTPDDTLLAAAQAGQLSTPDQVAAQAQRLIADPKHARALTDFHQQWLLNVGTRVANLDGLMPEGGLTQAAVDALSTEFTSFLTAVYSTGDGTLNTFLTGPFAFVNKDLAAIYGVPAPAGATATTSAKVMLDPTQRGGLFTQAAFLSSFSLGMEGHPVFRGLSVFTKLLCGTVMSLAVPPPGVNMMNKATNRQTFDAHGSAACASMCHSVFDPPGFAFENYDGTGKFRTTDNGFPVDATGTFMTPLGSTITFTNAIDMMKQLAALPETALCVERQWTRYMLGRLESDSEKGSLELAYKKGSATTGFSLRDMLTSLVTSKAYLFRQPTPGETL